MPIHIGRMAVLLPSIPPNLNAPLPWGMIENPPMWKNCQTLSLGGSHAKKKKTPRKQMKRWKCPWKIGGQIASQKQRVPSANPHQLSLPHYIKVIIQLFDSQNRLSTSGGLKGVLTFLGIPNHPVVDNHDLKLLCPGDHTRSIQGTEKSLPHRHCEWASRYGQL